LDVLTPQARISPSRMAESIRPHSVNAAST
jgi:hypothetical protein